MIPCPQCKGVSVGWDEQNKPVCLCKGAGTIPDRRKPTASDRAVERIKALRSPDRVVPQHQDKAYYDGIDHTLDAVMDIIREEAERHE